MSRALRVLHLEDDARDAELVRDVLEAGGITCVITRVYTREDFIASLEKGDFDVILADYSLPSFDGMSALHIAAQRSPDVPYIFVSGTLGEEVAIEALKTGATDYVLKERLSGVVPSVHRALREGRERTDRMRAEEAARAAKARFEGILDIALDAIISIDSQHRITLFNQGAESTFGYAQAEVIGRPLDLLLPAQFADAHRKHVDEFARSADMARTMGQRGKVSGRRRDGSEFPADASISKLEVGGELVLTVILRDVTDRVRLEAELRRSQKMEAVGTLAGGIAHDFNNILGAILGYGELAQRKVREGRAIDEELDQVMQAGQRAKRLVEHILAFSRSGLGHQVPVHVQSVVTEALALLAASLPAGVRLQQRLAAGDA
ncbi:MAG TPA: PAS domain S-box protein, partial [Caldimonas sp.]|nr:PAS domain S-box protein [Caldimonas sp.]